MARILILSLVFPPDGVSTAILYGALAEELQDLGHEITILTTTPHYNQDVEASRKQPLRKKAAGFYYESNYHGMRVLHAPVQEKGTRIITRLFDYMSFHAISTLAAIMMKEKYDLILAPSPPLTVGLSAWLVGKIRQIPYVYNVQEIFPDIAVKLGILKNKQLIHILEQVEKFIYSHSANIVVISEWFRQKLLAKRVNENAVTVIPNFTDTNFVVPMNRTNSFSNRHGLNDKFVVSYAGNIGLTQCFENILGAAKKLAHLEHLQFLLVGDGSRREWLATKISQEKSKNIILLPYQPRSVVPEIYASSDVCLVPLKGGTAQETFPSKIYTILSAGRASLVAADENSELTWLVRKAQSGWSVPPDCEDSLVNAIEYAYHNRQETFEKGKNGRDYVVQYHSRQAVAVQFDHLIRQLVRGKDC
jgi:colanic acid biosynthesis glycosyl transferase WcaI